MMLFMVYDLLVSSLQNTWLLHQDIKESGSPARHALSQKTEHLELKCRPQVTLVAAGVCSLSASST